MGKKEMEKESKLIQCIRCSSFGAIIALIFCTVIILICSVSISRGWLSEKNLKEYVWIASGLGCFLGATISASKTRSKTLLIGLFTSVLLFLIQVIIGYIAYYNASIGENGLFLFLADLTGGVLAGLLSGRRRKKKKSKHVSHLIVT